MATSYFINNVSIEELGLKLTNGGPIVPSFSVSRDKQSWPGRIGVLQAPYGTVDARVLQFTVNGDVSTAAARTTLVNTLLHMLTGRVEVRDRDNPDKVLRGTLSVYDTSVLSPKFVNVVPTVNVSIECGTATKHDRDSQSRVLSTTPVQIPVGTASHGGRIFISGAAAGALSTSVTLTYRAVNGAIISQLVFLPALASGEYAVLDLDRQEFVKVSTSNVQSDVESWITSGDYFKIFPRHANPNVPQYATLEQSNGAGLYTFRCNWNG